MKEIVVLLFFLIFYRIFIEWTSRIVVFGRKRIFKNLGYICLCQLDYVNLKIGKFYQFVPYGVVVNIAVFHTAATSSILVMGEIQLYFIFYFYFGRPWHVPHCMQESEQNLKEDRQTLVFLTRWQFM